MSDDQCHQSPAIESYIMFSTDNVKYLNFYKNTFSSQMMDLTIFLKLVVSVWCAL